MLPEEIKRRGLEAILTECLHLERDEELLVLFDETSAEYAETLSLLALGLAANCTAVLVPRLTQKKTMDPAHWPDPGHLPRVLVAGLFEAMAIVNILSGDLELKRFRVAVLRSPRRRDARLAHIPGLTEDIIRCLTETQFKQIRELAENTALALGEAKFVELKSGRDCVLEIEMEGWGNEPIQSPGTILPGSWGNVPPGETFCCPTISNVNGKLCIDGSVPRLVMDDGENIVLTIESGKVVGWESTSDRLHTFFSSRKAKAESEGDDNWNAVCELGVGLNPSIRQLVGNSTFDEKMYGTVHVALGDNSPFGHPIKSSWHADMVVRFPTLLVDGTPLVSEGAVNADSTRWETDAQLLDPVDLAWCENRHVIPSRVHYDESHAWRRVTKAGRVSHVRMGNEETSRALAEMLAYLASCGNEDIASCCKRSPVFSQVPALKLAACLRHFRVV